MKIKNNITFLALFVAITIAFSSCRKADRDEDTDLSAAQDNEVAEHTFAAIANTIGEVVDSLPQLRLSSCVNYTLVPADSVTFPKTLTINYGTLDCYSADGSIRRGIITATISGKYRDSLTTINISLQNFYYNKYYIQVTGMTLTNKGRNAAGNINFTETVTKANITTTNGNIEWNASRNMEWIAGAGTVNNPYDDVYSITGTESGRGANGDTYSVTINSPLISALNCQYIQLGKFTLIPDNLNERYFDYLKGGCDNQASVTLNDHTTYITIY